MTSVEYGKWYRKEHKAERAAAARIYYLKNRDAIRAQSRQYIVDNAAKVRASRQEYYLKNKYRIKLRRCSANYRGGITMNWTRELRQKEYEKKRQDYSKVREEKEMLEADCTNCCHLIMRKCEYGSVLEDGEMYCGLYQKYKGGTLK